MGLISPPLTILTIIRSFSLECKTKRELTIIQTLFIFLITEHILLYIISIFAETLWSNYHRKIYIYIQKSKSLIQTLTTTINLNNMPQLTIITINRNDAQGLEKTLESIWEKQSFKNFEHIIIDGASTDNSINIIKKYASHLSYWVSEPDKGIYNAMNKGIIKAKGNYLLFLNSGDWLENDILTRVFKESFTEDIVYADLYLYRNADDIQISPYPDKLTLPFIYRGVL